MKLIDAFHYSPDVGDGIIYYLQNTRAINDIPIYAKLSDVQYFFNRSGNKTASPLIDYYVEQSGEAGYLTPPNKLAVANVINSEIFADLEKIYTAYFMKEYEPLENYDMEETRTPNLSDTFTPRAKITNESNSETHIYGANSTEPVPDGTAHTLTEQTNTGSDVTNRTGTERLTRHGNIGVTTSQQMLQSELKLREYKYTDYVYKILDKYLTIPLYYEE